MSRALFAISDDLAALRDLMLETDELTPETEDALDHWLGDLVAEAGDKADAVFGLIRTWEGEIAVAKEERDRCQKFISVRESRVRRVKDGLRLALESAGLKEITSPLGRTFAVQKNGGAPAIEMDAVDVSTIDPSLTKTVTVPDPGLVRAALEAGMFVPFARLKPVGTHLRIR